VAGNMNGCPFIGPYVRSNTLMVAAQAAFF
jgi:hypothetical protein